MANGKITKQREKDASSYTASPRPTSRHLLTVNEPGDRYEQEADRVADQVVRMPDPGLSVQRACSCGGTCASCSEKKRKGDPSRPPLVQRSANADGGGMAAPPQVGQTLRSAGRPLSAPVRDDMERRFGADFGHVRLHTDRQATEAARSIDAQAFTAGNHIAFDAGRYAPTTGAGQKLLAHELTHVLQQRPKRQVSRQSDGEEGDKEDKCCRRKGAGGSIADIARDRCKGKVAKAYRYDPCWWFSPNRNLAGAKCSVPSWETWRGASGEEKDKNPKAPDYECYVNWCKKGSAQAQTCNLFVYDVLHAAGKDPPLHGKGQYYGAGKTHKTGADNYLKQIDRSEIKPGDIFTVDAYHMEVIVSVGDGGSTFASAGGHEEGAYIDKPSRYVNSDNLKFWRAP